MTKKLQFSTDHIIEPDRDTITDLIYDYLVDMGLKIEWFNWSIEVEYKEEENNGL